MPCYREIGFFGWGKLGHIIRDCLENKRLMLKKRKEDSKDDRQKARAQGRAFPMTHRDAWATSNVVTGTLQIHTLFSRVLIDPGLTHSFVLISFDCFLGMHISAITTRNSQFIDKNDRRIKFCW